MSTPGLAGVEGRGDVVGGGRHGRAGLVHRPDRQEVRDLGQAGVELAREVHAHLPADAVAGSIERRRAVDVGRDRATHRAHLRLATRLSIVTPPASWPALDSSTSSLPSASSAVDPGAGARADGIGGRADGEVGAQHRHVVDPGVAGEDGTGVREVVLVEGPRAGGERDVEAGRRAHPCKRRDRGVVPLERPAAVGVLGDVAVGRGWSLAAHRVALGVRGGRSRLEVRGAQRAEAVGQGVRHAHVIDVAVFGGLEVERPHADVALDDRGVVHRLVDRKVLGGAGEADVVGDRQRPVVVAGRPRVVGQRLLVARLGARVVVEVRPLGPRRRGRRHPGRPGRGVLADRDRRDVAQRDGLARAERARRRREAHVGVDSQRPRAAAVGVGEQRLDEGWSYAARSRRGVARVERPGAQILGGLAGVGGRVGGVVRGAAAKELEPRRQVVVDHEARGGLDAVVADVQCVDGLVVVGAAQQLALGAGLGLQDLDRGDLRRRGIGGEAGVRVGLGPDRRARGGELGQIARVAVDVRAGVVGVRAADGVGGGRVAHLIAQAVGRSSAQVRHVLEEERGLSGGRRVRQHARRDAGRACHVRDADRQHVAEAEVVADGGAGRVGRAERDRGVLAEEHAPGRVLVHRDVRRAGSLGGGRGNAQQGDQQREKE